MSECESVRCPGLQDLIMRMDYAEKIRTWQATARAKRMKVEHAKLCHVGAGGGDSTIKYRLSRKLAQAGVANPQVLLDSVWDSHSSTLRSLYGNPHQIADK
eukprot:2691363-Amphidinium_carterae.1